MSKDLSKYFEQDKEHLINITNAYLSDTTNTPAILLETKENDLDNYIRNQKWGDAIEHLEKLKDLRTGIITTEKENIIIRDARNKKEPRVDGPESFEMQYLNSVRSAEDVIELSDISDKDKNNTKILLHELVKRDFSNINKYSRDISQKEIGNITTSYIDNIASILERQGIADPYSKLNIAKDYQNFKDKHRNISTITKVMDREHKSYVVVESETAFKKLTNSQVEEYQAIHNRPQHAPVWFEFLPDFEKQLCRKYSPIIAEGDHVINAQLRKISGLRNAFEKITSIVQDNKLQILHCSRHAGAVASLSKHDFSAKSLTISNMNQALEWVGATNSLHCNTLNSGPIGATHDPRIVELTAFACKNLHLEHTNSAFNSLRVLGASNDFTGARNMVKNSIENLDFSGNPNESAIKKMLSGKINDSHKPTSFIMEQLGKFKVDPDTIETIKDIIDLHKVIKLADKSIRVNDTENLSLTVSTKMNLLSYKLRQSRNPVFAKIPKPIMLTMCASGKDRTGLAQHDQAVQAIQNFIGKDCIDISELDRFVLPSGHTAEQAGSIYAGGATIGCHGTKSYNKAGLPKSRECYLEGIVQVSAHFNKIESHKKREERRNNEKVENALIDGTLMGDSVLVTKAGKKKSKKIVPAYTPNIKNLDKETRSGVDR